MFHTKHKGKKISPSGRGAIYGGVIQGGGVLPSLFAPCLKSVGVGVPFGDGVGHRGGWTQTGGRQDKEGGNHGSVAGSGSEHGRDLGMDPRNAPSRH